MEKVLITGGSGFIGTNLAADFLKKKQVILSIDRNDPQNKEHLRCFCKVNLLDQDTLKAIIKQFQPVYVIHLAARTDLDGKTLEDYSSNIKGLENLLHVLSKSESVKRCIFISSKLVCQTGYTPKFDNDYKPDTLYGESKFLGEKLLRLQNPSNYNWCICRPSSIWGPWFDMPYKYFFLAVAKGRYFHPGNIDPNKSFGYVGNIVYQIDKLLDAPEEKIQGKTFYLSDYEEFTIRQWADMISLKLKGKKVKNVPDSFIKLAALSGDMLKKIGVKNPPLTTFRLNNMQTDTTGIPLDPIKKITGPLPYTMENGVDHTIDWLKMRGLIH